MMLGVSFLPLVTGLLFAVIFFPPQIGCLASSLIKKLFQHYFGHAYAVFPHWFLISWTVLPIPSDPPCRILKCYFIITKKYKYTPMYISFFFLFLLLQTQSTNPAQWIQTQVDPNRNLDWNSPPERLTLGHSSSLHSRRRPCPPTPFDPWFHGVIFQRKTTQRKQQGRTLMDGFPAQSHSVRPRSGWSKAFFVVVCFFVESSNCACIFKDFHWN